MTYLRGIYPGKIDTFSVLKQVSGFVPTSLFNKCRETIQTFNFQLLRGYGQLRLGNSINLTSARLRVCTSIHQV